MQATTRYGSDSDEPAAAAKEAIAIVEKKIAQQASYRPETSTHYTRFERLSSDGLGSRNS